jgi:dTDP-4-amino-4,6-dideoxygalactose transaminase
MLPMWLKDVLWGVVKSVSPRRTGTDIAPAASSGGYEFDAAWLDKRMTRISRWIMKLASKNRIVERRRHNYLLLLEGVRGVPGAEPLFPKLPGGVVPYMFPLLVDDPARVFPALKQLGVPMLRWETFAPGVSANEAAFPVSHNLSRRLLQFPCHEELTAVELRWMIGAIRNVLSSGAPAGPAQRTKLEGAYEVEASSGR